ncbi:hypothetical protein J7K99_02925, partial [bacterium]|nr:hypothetical protein [bacterium]
MIKYLGKRILRARWQILNSRWVEIERSSAEYILQMLTEVLEKRGIPAEVRITDASLPALGIDALAPGAGGSFGAIYVLAVPERMAGRARKIITNLKSQQGAIYGLRNNR